MTGNPAPHPISVTISSVSSAPSWQESVITCMMALQIIRNDFGALMKQLDKENRL